MPELYKFKCSCLECLYTWISEPSEKPPFSCPECESNDIEILNKEKVE